MVTAHLVASTLASLAYLLRHSPGARDLQAATLEHLGRLVDPSQPLVITAGLESLEVNDTSVPIDAPGAKGLNEQLLLQGIRRVEFSPPLQLERVTGLCTVLAAFPGTFESFAELERAAGGGIGSGLSLAEAPSELTFERYTPVAPLLPDPDRRPLIEQEGGVMLAEDGGLLQFPELDDLPDLDSLDRERADRLGATPVPDPADDDFSRRLSAILDRGRLAGRTENWEGLLQAALEILEIEAEAPTEAVGKAIRIELRRMLPKSQLYEIARLASSGGRKQDAIAILRKVGADSTEALMDLLVDAMSMGERRGFYSALTHMSEGHDVIIAHLQHPTWYVVRNAAELCGEMDLVRAVPDLVKQVGHEDERVRRSVAGALAKIGTPAALEPLRHLLADSSPAVRLRAVAALNPRRARGIVMPLALLLAKEKEPEILRETALALGRIGTPDAIQALAGMAQAGHRVLGLGGKPLDHRLWAVEALGRAGPPAASVLRPLLDDGDEAVRKAARAALDGLPAGPGVSAG